ncbi:MAG: formylglycine-generating enzyme family protein [Planctomycetes bacterium]|nr:formylglycine-generating enzyme family protein [Planctomycetota bacterium]
MRILFVPGLLAMGLTAMGLRLSADAAHQAKDPPKEITNSLEMPLIRIPAGTFTMGSPADEKHRNADETQHDVKITKPFYLSVYEVTQHQYATIMGKNPSHFCKTGGGKQQVLERDTSHYPVERVSWNDAVEFCKKLSAKENKTYRLPTEAEWEYACRAGTKTVFSAGNEFHSYLANINGLNYSSYGKEVSGPFYRCTRTVGEYKRNAFGLADMHGNVQEWCADWYGEDYYKNSPKEDPSGPKEGTERVSRGGAWPSSAKACRSASRNHLAPDEKTYTTGFRVVLETK